MHSLTFDEWMIMMDEWNKLQRNSLLMILFSVLTGKINTSIDPFSSRRRRKKQKQHSQTTIQYVRGKKQQVIVVSLSLSFSPSLSIECFLSLTCSNHEKVSSMRERRRRRTTIPEMRDLIVPVVGCCTAGVNDRRCFRRSPNGMFLFL